MKVIDKVDNYHDNAPTVLTIGTFDGVHIGHTEIIQRLVADAHSKNYKSCLLTFFPHPRAVLQRDLSIKLLTTLEEKGERLESLGLDTLVIHPFSREFSRLTAREYVERILVEKLHIKKIVVGYDHRFGRNREADINELRYFSQLFDFEVEEIGPQDIDDVAVSSTKIRTALTEGLVEKANQYLGYCYQIEGVVTKGRGLGKEIGFPTANLHEIHPTKLIPAEGAYIVSAKHQGKLLRGIMNIGRNPTVGGKGLHLEVHFLEFEQELYGETLTINFHKRIRSEQKFGNLEALKNQLELDKSSAISFFKHAMLT
jgi:riboflavin kinase/FMN adenylyltransferase